LTIGFENSYWGIFLIVCLAGSGAISYLMYFKAKDTASLSRIQIFSLFTLRAIGLFLIFILLLSPLIKHHRTIKEQPVILIALDNSESIKKYKSGIDSLTSQLSAGLKKKYQIEYLTFGDKIEHADSISGSGKVSDYSQLLREANNSYLNRNVGALVLIGDGIYNRGQNPVYLAEGLNFPVYTVAFGDSTIHKDARISNVRSNKVTYLNNQFPVEIELNFTQLNGSLAKIEIENNGSIVYSNTLSINTDNDFKLEYASILANKKGLQHYKARVLPLDGEINLENNEFEIVVQVLENKQKILAVSDGPHPDLGAIKNSLLGLQNYDFSLVSESSVPENLGEYSLLIVNQLPSVKSPSVRLTQELKESRIPVLFILGPQTNIPQFNNLNMNFGIKNQAGTEEATPRFAPAFTAFTVSENIGAMFEYAPPLVVPFGTTESSPLLQTLALQTIKGIATPNVLIGLGAISGRRIGYIAGEGIWRWRLQNYLREGNHEAFDELIRKIIQYLSLKENEDNFNVYYSATYPENNEIEITADLYNDSYEQVNDPEVNLTLKNDSSKEFTYTFDRISNYYKLNLGMLQPGDYRFTASTKLGEKSFEENGTFSVLALNTEMQNTTANLKVMNDLAAASGGTAFYKPDFRSVVAQIEDNKNIAPEKHVQTNFSEMINLKLVFAFLVLVFGAEWFLRKFWGIY
jgi:hypothetical protein